jgi:protein-disulfide isomerase
MRKGPIYVVAIIAAVAGGFTIGRYVRKPGGGTTAEVTAPGGGATDGVERKRVPLLGTARGPVTAPITIVEFSDFQCPYCGKVAPTLAEVEKKYQGKVRVYFGHFPLPFHPDAPLASEAALAADAQGKFWEMHDKLFANQQAIKRPDLEKAAGELGLDLGKFKAALDQGTFKARVASDTAVGQRLGVNGTPAFFINGRELVGAVPASDFEKIIDEELVTANKLLASGTPPARLYDALLARSGPGKAPGAAAPSGPAKPNIGTETYKVVVGKAPVRGAEHPKVTIVEFSDFQCPYCGRANASVDRVLKEYGKDVAVAFKNFPLTSIHPNAMPAAIAAVAAGEQGKFWQMHDKLFANQQALDRPSLEKYAQEIGLDLTRFKAALDASKGKDAIEADTKEGGTFGVRGTPSFFINGHLFRGAQPFESFKAVIDDEIKKADAKIASGTPRAEVYAALTKDGLDKAAAPPAPPPSAARGGEPQPGVAYRVDVGNAPVKGPKDALVTIVQFSDFQCPFCSRVEPTINQVMQEYKGKVRVAWKDMPLPFHPNAMPAAIAARAAGEQGKFWEMHDKLFANQQSLSREVYEKYAQELHLDMGRFKSALDASKGKDAIQADITQGNKFGANGTPAFFINGTNLSGAQPFDAFKARIDEELKKAEALVSHGTKKAKVYDAIMKTAKTELAAGGDAAGGGGPSKVFKVDAGDAPARGPKNAPVTLVLFSDFQCPFCKRVEPTITQLEKEYPGKVRVVWKNFPLPFHPNAKPAANAALAAAEQGKFWEMHDKLFENQQSLDRASYEKYAQELGLNMARFKSALDSNKFDAKIASEAKEGAALEVNGTPASFINGHKIDGASPYEEFKKVVDAELAKPPTAVAARRRRG